MAEIDHLVYAVPDLADGIDRFEAQLGVRPEIGGRHPGMGTWNALLALDTSHGADCYLELIAADPDQPDPEGPRPFGIDEDPGPRLATYAVRPSAGESIESLIAVLAERGHDPGPAMAMSRATPTGDELHWRLTFPAGAGDGFLPFLIDWGATPSPATTIGSRAVVESVGGTPPADLVELLNALQPVGLDLGGVEPTGLAATLRVGDRTMRL